MGEPMRLTILVAALAASGMAAWADECPAPGTISVTGTVHGISTMREEPQAEAETFFTIKLVKAICGKSEIMANRIGTIACKEGDAIEVTGAFSPPSQLTGSARLKASETPICKAAK